MSSYSSILDEIVWHSSIDNADTSARDRVRLLYERARIMCQHIDLSVGDIANLTPKFWNLHQDMIVARDSAVTTVLTIHWNLCMGTISRYAEHRRDLQELLAELQSFSVCGEFMLTEFNHGLDARRLQTTATMQSDGSFILNTPSVTAAKVMPPTTPWAGIPRVAVVFAKLIVDGRSHGVKPFVVRINEADRMCPGITSRALPKRPGAKAVDHAITSFSQVRLKPESLLGSHTRPEDERKDFFSQIERVCVGTFTLSATNIPSLRLCAYIAGKYSQRRLVAGPKNSEVPIISFSTQLRPIINAFAQAAVFGAFADSITQAVSDGSMSRSTLSAMACIFKATVIHASQLTYNELIDRCGWQGLFAYNQISEITLAERGNSIAEGDVLVLCIKLASELILGRQTLPEARDPSSLLAKHEAGVWEEVADLSSQLQGSHRSSAFNTLLLPRCRYLIQTIGQRMAYEAAAAPMSTSDGSSQTKPRVSADLLALYESTCVMYDESWYVQCAGFTRGQLLERDADAAEALRPSLDSLLAGSGAEPWVTAPILKEEDWKTFVQQLPCFTAPPQPQAPLRKRSFARLNVLEKMAMSFSQLRKGAGELAV